MANGSSYEGFENNCLIILTTWTWIFTQGFTMVNIEKYLKYRCLGFSPKVSKGLSKLPKSSDGNLLPINLKTFKTINVVNTKVRKMS